MADDSTLNDLVELRDEILYKMYRAAEPGLNWYELTANPDEYADDFYQHHHLPHEEQLAILDHVFDTYSLRQTEKRSLQNTCIIDLGPTSIPLDDSRSDESNTAEA